MMALFDDAIKTLNEYEHFSGYMGSPPESSEEYDAIKSEMFSGSPPTWEQIQNAIIGLKAADQREKRNALIAETDHWVLSDTPQPSQEQLDYRQALRDITAQAGFPDTIDWPVKPE